LKNFHLTRATQDVLRAMARARRAPLQSMSAQEARASYELGANVLELPKPVIGRLHDHALSTRDGQQIRARLYRPHGEDAGEPLPALLFFHGGGFTIGSIETHDILCRQLCLLAGCAVLSVDYRLAPEHKFPTADDDAWDALQWLHANAAVLHVDAARLAVGGDSAGGTLAASVAIQARDAGLPLALQLLFYPGCAAHQDTPSHHRFAEGFLLEEAQITWFFNHYVRSRSDRDDWRFAPLNAPDVEGVAPAWIGLAELDPLVDEGILYGDKLRASGVHVDLEIYRGVTHEFIKMGRVIAEAKVAHAHAAQALRQAFSL
jgi:acetyl esterase